MFLSPAYAFTKAAGWVGLEVLSLFTIERPRKSRVFINNDPAPDDLFCNQLPGLEFCCSTPIPHLPGKSWPVPLITTLTPVLLAKRTASCTSLTLLVSTTKAG